MAKSINIQRVRNEIHKDRTAAIYELIDKLKPAYLCPFNITGGILYQNAKGEQGLDNKLANFNAIFSGNNPIVVEWAKTTQAYYYKNTATYTDNGEINIRYVKLPLLIKDKDLYNEALEYIRAEVGSKPQASEALLRLLITLPLQEIKAFDELTTDDLKVDEPPTNTIDTGEGWEGGELFELETSRSLTFNIDILQGYTFDEGAVLEVKLTGKNTNVILQRESSSITNQDVIKAYKDGTLEVIVKATDWTNELLFSLWTYPQQEGTALYYIASIVDYENGEGDTKYHQLTLKKVENQLAVLNGGTYQQYIHFYKPAQRFYALPKYNKELNTIEPSIEQVEAAASLQIDILGKSLFSGVVLTTDTEPYIPYEALQPITTELDTYTNKQQRYVYLLDAGITNIGEWESWKAKLRADQGDLSAIPDFEGVITFGRVLGEAQATGNSGKYVIFNRDTSKFLKAYRYSPYGSAISYTDDVALAYLFGSKNEADNFIKAQLRNTNGTLVSQPQQGTVLEKDIALPLYGNSTFSFAQTLKTPNVEKNLQQETFTKALAANSLANMDTFFLPVEISQNYYMDLTTLPIIGSIIGALTFGVPVGVRSTTSTTNDGFYDRKYNFLTSITTKQQLSDSFYGVGDNRLAIDKDLPLISDIGLSSSYHFSLGRTETIATSRLTLEAETITSYNKEFIQKNELDVIPKALFIQAVGKAQYKVSFLTIDKKIVWQGYFNSFALSSGDMRNWTTAIVF